MNTLSYCFVPQLAAFIYKSASESYASTKFVANPTIASAAATSHPNTANTAAAAPSVDTHATTIPTIVATVPGV